MYKSCAALAYFFKPDLSAIPSKNLPTPVSDVSFIRFCMSPNLTEVFTISSDTNLL